MPIPGIIASSKSGHLVTGNFSLIQKLTPTAASSVTFSSIPSTYKSLQIRYSLFTPTNGQIVQMTINGDSSVSDYTWHYLAGYSTAKVASGSATGNFGYSVINGAGLGTVNSYPNVGIVDIIDYANTSKYKTVKSFAGVNGNNVGTNDVEIDSSLWLSTSAINSLLFNGFTMTGTISLYGVS